jgi:Zn-finger nucleic acid-binding protein
MQCPKCSGTFGTVNVGDIEVDRCGGCHGLWFDMLEHEDLAHTRGGSAVDTGDAATGRAHDGQRDIRCPRCHVAMLSMVASGQYHIHYESCPSCHGTFFDAGEFRDLSRQTLGERLGELLRALRANL